MELYSFYRVYTVQCVQINMEFYLFYQVYRLYQ